MLQHVGVAFLICSSLRSYSATKSDKHNHPKILDIVTKRGYPFEIHRVITSDGYILTMFRIPRGKANDIIPNKPILLQHGMSASADDFLISDVTHGLGYVLADNGYDVWLGNWRGSEHSRHHTSLNPDKDPLFWNFSWHEMGIFDLPAMVDYILNVSSQARLRYVGHSQGNTAFYVLASTRPEYNAKIIVQVSLAPVAYLEHTPNPATRTQARFVKPITKLFQVLKINQLFSSRQFIVKVFKRLCNLNHRICGDVIASFTGYNPNKLSTNLSTLLRFNPAGGSIKQLLHYLQEVNTKYFKWYDYGENNFEVYGTVRPPVYNLSHVTTPSYLFYSSGDKFVGEMDVDRLCRKISRACLGQFLIPYDNFTHIDFTLGIRAPELVYEKMVGLLKKYL